MQPCKSWEIDCLVSGLKVIWFNLHLLIPQGCGFPGALHKVGQGIPPLGLTTMGAELAQNLHAPLSTLKPFVLSPCVMTQRNPLLFLLPLDAGSRAP